ncbi:sensor histidine kinase [Enteroscipio rubneri]|nr:GHKL domain-containing protein [Enteroscipio rubneri]
MSSLRCTRTLAACIAVLVLTGAVFAAGYFYDNKYAVSCPRGADAEFAFTSDELDRPLVLIDGWLMDLEGVGVRETFIGQYSNFSYVPGSPSPDGQAVYTLALRAVDMQQPVALTLFVPEVFGDYVLRVDGEEIASRGSGAFAGIVVDGTALLEFDVESAGGYYSGLVYPPVVGTAQVMGMWQAVRTATSGAACFAPLVLAALACAVWAPRRNDHVLMLFAVLCLCMSGACFEPFAWQLGWSGPWLHAAVDALWTAVLSCATAMALIVSGLADSARRRRVVFSLLAVAPLASGLLVGAGIPAFPALIGVNEAFQIVFRLTAWALVMAAAAAGLRSRLADAPYVLCAAIAMALAFAANLLDAGAYEPLYGLWQNEYAALAAMAAFAALIVARGRRMVAHEAAAHELDVQLRAAEQTLAHIRASEDATRVMRHDLKHHANALAMLATEGEWDRARAYACELSEGLAVIAPVRYSRNLVVNAACAAYLAAATEQGVEVRCDVRVPEKLPVRDGDLAVLLSNLLSNAVEGCWRAPEGSRRALRFDADWNGEALCMRCENSAPEGTPSGRTSKRDPAEHGFGLTSMRQIAQRYGGSVTVRHADGLFVVRCVLRLGRQGGAAQTDKSSAMSGRMRNG